MRRALAAVIELFPERQREQRGLVPALDDAEILAAVKRGDAHAATALYRRARPPAERTVQRLLGRRDRDHDDLIQTSLIELIRSIPSFRGECSLDTWITRITTRAVFRAMRRRNADRTIFDASQHEADGAAQAYGATTAEVNARDVIARIRHHLSAMDENRAWTVMLHDVCGHDLREIAEITSCSIAAAQSRLVRGRTELHERIEGDPDLAGRLEPKGQRR